MGRVRGQICDQVDAGMACEQAVSVMSLLHV